ncbi:hypothetical protein LJK87_08120 [Paenibacillus sp. P25]|nr:hypothetical protein LJK87_08120 [Paenibacillus sp. P25]
MKDKISYSSMEDQQGQRQSRNKPLEAVHGAKPALDRIAELAAKGWNAQTGPLTLVTKEGYGLFHPPACRSRPSYPAFWSRRIRPAGW